jgi:general secretion pathway protein D
MKQAFEFLAKSFGINVIFDEGIKSVPVTLFGKDVTFDQGLNLLLATSKVFYKRIGPNTILIAPDTKEKRGQYEDHLVRTFQLNIVRAKEMADIIKGIVNLKKITINETLNTLVIRDTEDVLKLVERLIASNDRKVAEIILDVEILEVNRNKTERLGLDLGTYSISAGLPSPGTIPVGASVSDSWQNTATLTLPTATFRLFKQDVDAKILANPKVRVTSGKSAKIHVGDRVPLRVSSIVDATGQSRTQFDYKEIGIRLSVEPTVHLDNSALVKLALEVSSLGENLGTTNEPAFRIGTRNADTIMLLRDGETAILGGLIRDEERKSHVKIPWFGDIPLVGGLFTSFDDSAGRTDVLLTITPRVVRGWDVPSRQLLQFYSGTENVYSEKPVFSALEAANGRAAPGAGAQAAVKNPGSQPPAANDRASDLDAADPEAEQGSVLAFNESIYEVVANQELAIQIVGFRIPSGAAIPLEVLYNPQLLSYVSGAKGDLETRVFNASADPSQGVLKVVLDLATTQTAEQAVLARLVLRGAQSGISYLVFRAPNVKDANGQPVKSQVRAARVVVK